MKVVAILVTDKLTRSQLLEILLDLNESLNIPKSLRYDIRLPNQLSEYDAYDLSRANVEIMDAHASVQNGDYPQASYHQFRHDLEESLARRDVRKVDDMDATIPHPLPEDADVHVLLQPEYLTSAQQDAYLLAMDAKQGDNWSLSQPIPPAPTNLSSLTPRELEREIELRNPLSVHNWLKKHNLQAAAKEEDNISEAGAPVATPATNRKRGNNLAKKVGDRSVNQARGEKLGSPASVKAGDISEVGPDDDGDDKEQVLSASARKKGGDKDDTYRPKGGRASKAKRKRETLDGDSAPTPKGKKAKTSVPASASEN